MKTITLLLILTSAVISQTIEKPSINNLMLESKYSQVVKTLSGKMKKGAALSTSEKFNLAISYQRLVNHSKAISILELLSREEPSNSSVLFAIAESHRAMGNSQIASVYYQKVISIDSSNIIAQIELGKLYTSTKEYNKAKDIFQYLVSLDSTNSYYLRQYGFSLYKLDKKEEAKKHLKSAVSLNEFDPKAILWLAKIHFDLEEYEEALKILKDTSQFHSNNLPLNKMAAEILFKMKKYKSAAAQYNNVIALGDSSSIIFQKLGLSLYSSVATSVSIPIEKIDEVMWEAVEALERSLIKEEFKNPLTLTYLGFCFNVLRIDEKSIYYLEEALNAITPEYIDMIYSTLGTSYEFRNDYYKSIIAYSKSLEYNNENPYIVFRLATLYDRYYADKSVAVAHYKKYLRTNMDGDEKLIKYAENSIERLNDYIHFGQ